MTLSRRDLLAVAPPTVLRPSVSERYTTLKADKLRSMTERLGKIGAVDMLGPGWDESPAVVEWIGTLALGRLLGSGYEKTLEECVAVYRGEDAEEDPNIWKDLQ